MEIKLIILVQQNIKVSEALHTECFGDGHLFQNGDDGNHRQTGPKIRNDFRERYPLAQFAIGSVRRRLIKPKGRKLEGWYAGFDFTW